MTILASFWKSGMQSQTAVDAALRERVATNAIYAQKMVDKLHHPEMNGMYSMEQRISVRPMYSISHPDIKTSDAGTRSTFLAATYYADEACKRRDELLAMYKAEEAV